MDRLLSQHNEMVEVVGLEPAHLTAMLATHDLFHFDYTSMAMSIRNPSVPLHLAFPCDPITRYYIHFMDALDASPYRRISRPANGWNVFQHTPKSREMVYPTGIEPATP